MSNSGPGQSVDRSVYGRSGTLLSVNIWAAKAMSISA